MNLLSPCTLISLATSRIRKVWQVERTTVDSWLGVIAIPSSNLPLSSTRHRGCRYTDQDNKMLPHLYKHIQAGGTPNRTFLSEFNTKENVAEKEIARTISQCSQLSSADFVPVTMNKFRTNYNVNVWKEFIFMISICCYSIQFIILNSFFLQSGSFKFNFKII